MTEKHYEMLWDCQFCGTGKLLGKTHRFCPNCGAPQDPDSRYFPSDADKVAVEDHVLVGRDKICASCNQLNAGNSEFCQQCGAPMAGASIANLVDSQVRGEGERFAEMASRDVVQERFDTEMERVGVKPKRGQKSNTGLIATAIALFVVAIGAVFFLLNWTETTQIYVTGHSWQRNIIVEEYQNVTVPSWRDSRPAGDNMSLVPGTCSQRQRGSQQIPDGQECSTRRVDNGDGTFSEVRECRTTYRSEPIYADWCTWRGQRWEFDFDMPTSGDSLQDEPYWDDVSLSCEGRSTVGCQRIGRRDETYEVVFRGDGINYTCQFNQDQWDDFSIESVWTINIRVVDNKAADCNSLQRAN